MYQTVVPILVIMLAIQCSTQSARCSPGSKTDAAAYNLRAVEEMNRGDYKHALTDLNKAIQANENYSLALINRGLLRSKIQDFKGALKDFSCAIRINPRDISALSAHANLNEKLRDYKASLADWNEIIRIYPQSEGSRFYYHSRALLKKKMGDITGSNDDLNKEKLCAPLNHTE